MKDFFGPWVDINGGVGWAAYRDSLTCIHPDRAFIMYSWHDDERYGLPFSCYVGTNFVGLASTIPIAKNVIDKSLEENDYGLVDDIEKWNKIRVLL